MFAFEVTEDVKQNFETLKLANGGNDWRWQVNSDRNPPCIVILRRGANREVILTISANGEFASLYPHWQPVIADWRRERVANGGKRTRHSSFDISEDAKLVIPIPANSENA